MNDDERGQVRGQPSALIPMLTVGIVVLVGIRVMKGVTDGIASENASEIDAVCAGLYGCGGPAIIEGLALIGVVLTTTLILGIGLTLRSHRGPKPTGEGNSDGVKIVKEQYVEGDIDSILELEDELDDVMWDGGDDDD